MNHRGTEDTEKAEDIPWPPRRLFLLSDLCASVVNRRHWLLAFAVAYSFTSARAAEKVAPPVTALAFVPSGKSVLAGSQAGVRQLSWPELKTLGTLKSALPNVHDLAFSPRGDLLAVAGGAPAEAGIVEVLSWPEGRLKYRIEPQADLIYAVAWSPDGRHFATASYDRAVNILDAATGRRVHKLEGHSRGVLAVCYLPDGKTLVSAGADNSLSVWEAESGRGLRSLENHTATVHALAAPPTQPRDAPPMVASVSDDRTVRLWQPTIGRMVRFARLASVPVAVAWSADGKTLVAACIDGHVRAIDAETLLVAADVAAIDGRAYSVATSPTDGKSFAVAVGGVDGQVKRVQITTSK